ncbi:MAG: hypothetical protein K1X92_11890 [Bacteroidia bacterium]|nr:hypothetical protein [Bacteroidia bacterium]
MTEELLKQLFERLKTAEAENEIYKKDLSVIVNFIAPIVNAVATKESVNIVSLIQSMPGMIQKISADKEQLEVFAQTFNKYIQ